MATGECVRPAAPDDLGQLVIAMRDKSHVNEGFDIGRALLDDLGVSEERILESVALERGKWAVGSFPAWDLAIANLAGAGRISRDALLDRTLEVLDRARDPIWSKSLRAFHDRRLKPTPRELATRQSVYVRWLESDRDAMVGFALGNLLRADGDGQIDGRAVLDNIAPALGAPAKTHARRAVVLVGRVLDREPGLVADGIDLAIEALAHQAADVQIAVVDVLAGHVGRVDHDQRAGSSRPLTAWTLPQSVASPCCWATHLARKARQPT